MTKGVLLSESTRLIDSSVDCMPSTVNGINVAFRLLFVLCNNVV